jgi:hypothetical protein
MPPAATTTASPKASKGSPFASSTPLQPLMPPIRVVKPSTRWPKCTASFAALGWLRSRAMSCTASSRPVPQTMWKRATELPCVCRPRSIQCGTGKKPMPLAFSQR